MIPFDELCPCTVPRKSPPRKPKVEPVAVSLTSEPSPTTIHNQHAPRPELHNPSPNATVSLPGPIHLPSSGAHHTRPHLAHATESFSPYGRAYDRAHVGHRSPSTESPTYLAAPNDGPDYWSIATNTVSAPATCANPESCGGCLQCIAASMAQIAPSTSRNNPLDEWMRQQLGMQYVAPPSQCGHGCPPGLCQCESGGCQSGCSYAPEKVCCKGPGYPTSPLDLTGGFFDIQPSLPRTRSSSSSSDSSTGTGFLQPFYAASNYSAGSSNPDLMYGAQEFNFGNQIVYAGSNPDTDPSYARSHPDIDMPLYSGSNPDLHASYGNNSPMYGDGEMYGDAPTNDVFLGMF
ncbi:hypothetical protein CYLTODRAFT_198480 [Cylindrobasidium torrendii FP15055 ss-10]|uniref:Copper-fist domain-containing protein n=1 Tax=Cylindrobasidium torrendii FP15055 ss-10 TaxID=1314674 RepID=A0A0D7BJ47_9AGAR|nr:hypothetical protein CYLTODRAFT_198480 [Cylindrobasidium torrendii FP15055 ss-10]